MFDPDRLAVERVDGNRKSDTRDAGRLGDVRAVAEGELGVERLLKLGVGDVRAVAEGELGVERLLKLGVGVVRVVDGLAVERLEVLGGRNVKLGVLRLLGGRSTDELEDDGRSRGPTKCDLLDRLDPARDELGSERDMLELREGVGRVTEGVDRTGDREMADRENDPEEDGREGGREIVALLGVELRCENEGRAVLDGDGPRLLDMDGLGLGRDRAAPPPRGPFASASSMQAENATTAAKAQVSAILIM